MLYPKGNGAADQQFVSCVFQLIHNVRHCRVDVVGLACDGDHGYLRFVNDMTNSMDIIDVTRPLHQQQVDSLMVLWVMFFRRKSATVKF